MAMVHMLVPTMSNFPEETVALLEARVACARFDLVFTETLSLDFSFSLSSLLSGLCQRATHKRRRKVRAVGGDCESHPCGSALSNPSKLVIWQLTVRQNKPTPCGHETKPVHDSPARHAQPLEATPPFFRQALDQRRQLLLWLGDSLLVQFHVSEGDEVRKFRESKLVLVRFFCELQHIVCVDPHWFEGWRHESL